MVFRTLVIGLLTLMPGLAWAQTTAGRQGPFVNVMDYGAKCDGVTNDSPKVNDAIAALNSQQGGTLYFPPNGHACLLQQGIELPSAVSITGASWHTWPGPKGPVGAWTAKGSWIQCADTRVDHPCVSVNGVGNIIQNINFIYDQPTPPDTGTWTPTIYPYTILINGPAGANYTSLENISITAATHCIDWEGPSNGVGGLMSWMSNINFDGCFDIGTRFHKIDNTLHMKNLRYTGWWYANTAVTDYIEHHKIDWDVRYLANAQAEGVEFYQSWRAIQFTNETVISGFGPVTFAANALQLTNMSFNVICQGIAVNGNDTRASGDMVNVIAWRDTATGCPGVSPIFFDLSSDAVNWKFANMRAGPVQTLFALGHGSGGSLTVIGVDVENYAVGAPGANAFKVSANTSVEIADSPMRAIRPAPGAGDIIGPGLDGTQGFLEPLQVGGGGPEGFVRVGGSQDQSHGGEVDFFRLDGTRHGYIGRPGPEDTLNISSDEGGVNIVGCPYGPGRCNPLSGNGSISLVPGGAGGIFARTTAFDAGIGGEGFVRLRSSGDQTNTGEVDFFLPGGTRHGMIGRTGTNDTMVVQSDGGALSLVGCASGSCNAATDYPGAIYLAPGGAGGGRMTVATTNAQLQVILYGIPHTVGCPPGFSTGALYVEAGALHVCP